MPRGCRRHDDLIAQERNDDAGYRAADVWEPQACSGSGAALRGKRGDRAQVKAPRQRSGSVGHRTQFANNAVGRPRGRGCRTAPSPFAAACRLLLLPLDDLLAVTREFLNPDVSRSGLDRCLRRHGVSNLKALLPKTPAEPRKTFKTCEPGFLHVDLKYLPQMADETTRRYLFVAIDRATRRVFVRIMPARPPPMRAGSCAICTVPAQLESPGY